MEVSWRYLIRVVTIRWNAMPPLSHPTQQVIDELIWQKDRLVVPPKPQCRFKQLGVTKAVPQ